jgi:hypothetical protein
MVKITDDFVSFTSLKRVTFRLLAHPSPTNVGCAAAEIPHPEAGTRQRFFWRQYDK